MQVYSPNNTNTRRYGLTTSLIYAPNDDNVVQVAYTLDWGLHRQTAEWSLFNTVGGPVDDFGGFRNNHANPSGQRTACPTFAAATASPTRS